MKPLLLKVLNMPSLLSGCFRGRQPRHDFGKRKRESRKKILHRGSDSGSEQSTSPEVSKHTPQEIKKNEDDEIMNRLLSNHQVPRRRHVEDIFRPDAPEVQAASRKSSVNAPPPQPCDETMYGYVPRAVATMSASTALTGEKFDDFFHDCHLNPALDKFAKSSHMHNSPFHMVPNNPAVEVDDDMLIAPSLVEIKVRDANTAFDEVIRGSVSSACPSPTPSDDFSSTPNSDHHSFLDQDEYDSNCTQDPVRTTYNSLFVKDPIGLTDNAEYDRNLESMFHRDGDVLY